MTEYPQTRRALETWLEDHDYQMQVQIENTNICKQSTVFATINNKQIGQVNILRPINDDLAMVLLKYSKIELDQRRQYHKPQNLPLPDVQTLSQWPLKVLNNPATTQLHLTDDQLSTLHHLQRQFQEGRWLEQ